MAIQRLTGGFKNQIEAESGAGGGYIFNLSTKGLAAGQYVMSFHVGRDHSFFYTVKIRSEVGGRDLIRVNGR